MQQRDAAAGWGEGKKKFEIRLIRIPAKPAVQNKSFAELFQKRPPGGPPEAQ